MVEKKLIEVRCPGLSFDKTKNKYVKCNKLCLKAYPGSSGQCYCRHCKTLFNFYIPEDATNILDVKKKIKKKKKRGGG